MTTQGQIFKRWMPGSGHQAAARRARDEWLAQTGEERTARAWTLERWLRYWSTRTSIRPTTKAALHPRRGEVPHPAPGQDLPRRSDLPPTQRRVRTDRHDDQPGRPTTVRVLSAEPAHDV